MKNPHSQHASVHFALCLAPFLSSSSRMCSALGSRVALCKRNKATNEDEPRGCRDWPGTERSGQLRPTGLPRGAVVSVGRICKSLPKHHQVSFLNLEKQALASCTGLKLLKPCMSYQLLGWRPSLVGWRPSNLLRTHFKDQESRVVMSLTIALFGMTGKHVGNSMLPEKSI